MALWSLRECSLAESALACSLLSVLKSMSLEMALAFLYLLKSLELELLELLLLLAALPLAL
jgi:hypothetical protein